MPVNLLYWFKATSAWWYKHGMRLQSVLSGTADLLATVNDIEREIEVQHQADIKGFNSYFDGCSTLHDMP